MHSNHILVKYRRPSDIPRRLLDLLETLTSFKVVNWGADSSEMASGEDRQVAPIDVADVVSSHIIGTETDPVQPLDFFSVPDVQRRHQVVLDIDHPAWLVTSTNVNHSHLYVQIPDGVPESHYFEFLDAAAKIGLIEPGYAEVSKQRGHTDVRLPWVAKPTVTESVAPSAVPTEDLGGLYS